MFKRTYLGLEIRDTKLRAIAIQRSGAGVTLLGGQTLQLSAGVLQQGPQAANISKPGLFIEAVREVLLPLARRENRIAVVLPDGVGYLFLLDIDTPFKKQEEGAEIIRWHLKDRLPSNYGDFALAYQIIEENDSGSKRVLVSLIAREVLGQYEQVLAKAGFAAAVIDFHSLNIYNAYRSRVDLGTDFMVVSADDNQLSILAFTNLKLDFYRVKSVPVDPAKVFQEINRSLVGYRRSHAAFARASVYLHSNWGQVEELREALQSIFERDIELLPSPLQHLINTEKLAISSAEANSMAAVLGVTERMIQRVRG